MRKVAFQNVAFLILLVSVVTGCRIDPNAEREIALLRSEILDLEDQYYTLRSRCSVADPQLVGLDGESPGVQYYEPSVNALPLSSHESNRREFFQGPLAFNNGSQSRQGSQTRGGIENGPANNCGCETQLAQQYQGQQFPVQPNFAQQYPVQQNFVQTVQPDIIYEDQAFYPDTTPLKYAPREPSSINANIPELAAPDVLPSFEPSELDPPQSILSSETTQPGFDEEFDDVEFNADEYSIDSVAPLEAPYEPYEYEPTVAGISINRLHSGGHDLDGRPGHEGLVLLVQPESLAGEIIQTPGSLNIVVTDPQLRRPKNLIAQWQFAPGEVQNFFVKEELAEQGILLHLPWDSLPPQNRKLLVNVKFTTDNNSVFESTREIEIEPPAYNYSADDPIVTQWVERDDRWKDIAVERRPNNNRTIQAPSFSRSRIPTRPASSQRQISSPEWKPVR